MKRILLLAFIILELVSCQESLEDRAAREAREYTAKNCPTPVENCSRTDSVAFDRTTKTYTYYCSFVADLDNSTFVAVHDNEIRNLLRKTLTNDVAFKKIKEAGFNFAYVVKSDSNPATTLFCDTIRPTDYQ